MQKIASFQVDHTVLGRGLYLSRTDGDVITYDIRCVRPNTPPFMPVAAMHTFEHLGATYLRNTAHKDGILYFGPMGCRTGFYLLTRGLSHETVIGLVQKTMAFVAAFEGDIPGVSEVECGNWREHDLSAARDIAASMVPVLQDWTPDKLAY